MRGHWWLRLQILQWVQSGRSRPLRRIVAVLAWWLPCLMIPLALRFAGHSTSSYGFDFLLSLDVPLSLGIAALTALDALRIESQASTEDWLWPRAFRPSRLRWLSLLRWLVPARWPAGLALAAAVLASGANAEPEQLIELMMMVFLGLLIGSAFAWAMRQASSSSAVRSSAARRARGMKALSWVALHETRERFALKRMMVLAIPALLAAPAGFLASDVMKTLALWMPLLFLVTVCRESLSTQDSLRRWLRVDGRMQLQLVWWVWRHVLLGIAAMVALYLLWGGTSMRAAGGPR